MLDIKLDKFLKVFTATGIRFVPLTEEMEDAPNEDIRDIKEVEGYGVRVGDTLRVVETYEEVERLRK